MLLQKPEDIDSVLLLSQLEGVPVQIRIRGTENIYGSSILKLFPGGDPVLNLPSILIRKLVPEPGNDILPLARFCHVAFTIPDQQDRTRLLTYDFNSVFVQKEICRDEPAFRISYPERRRYDRAVPDGETGIRILARFAAGDVSEGLVNISAGGVGFYTGAGVPGMVQGDRLRLDFELPGGGSIKTLSVLRWLLCFDPETMIQGRSRKYYCGIEFLEIDRESRTWIAEYVSSCNSRALDRLLRENGLIDGSETRGGRE